VLRGAPGRDEGSECNAPLPTSGNIRNFRFRGIDGRGNPRLVQEPSSGNYYVAVVNVQDPSGGDDVYTFELTWDSDGGGGGIFPNRPTTRPSIPPPGGSSLQDMSTGVSGTGTLEDGLQRYNLNAVNVRIKGDQCQITLHTDQSQQLEMSGRVIPQTTRCFIDSSNRGKTSADARITAHGHQVTAVNVTGTINGRHFQGNFQSRGNRQPR
jgi:hypothetical protein